MESRVGECRAPTGITPASRSAFSTWVCGLARGHAGELRARAARVVSQFASDDFDTFVATA